MNDRDNSRGIGTADHILVGVDASQSSIAALAWAAGQARLTGLPLLVVHAWSFIPYPYVNPVLVRETAQEAAGQVLDHAISEGIGEDDGITVHRLLVPGHPARVLADLGKSSRMVVIGGGGHGELAGLLLGSVGLHLAAHAPVPVVIVPRSEVELRVEEPASEETAPASSGDAPLYHPFTFL